MAVRRQRRLVVVLCLAVATVVAACGLSLFDTIESLMEEGRQLYAAHRYDEAIAKFERVTVQDSTYWLAYIYIARCYIAKLGWGSAIVNARKAYQLAPGGGEVVPVFAEALFGGGLEALRQAKFSDAVGHLVEYIRIKPTDPRGYLNVGKAYLGTGAFGDALGAFVRGLGQGGDAAVRQELLQGLLDGGLQALSRGDARGAIGFFTESVRQDPRNFSGYLNLGKAYWQSGERLQALDAFRRVLELSPGHGEALQFLRMIPR